MKNEIRRMNGQNSKEKKKKKEEYERNEIRE